MDANAVGHQCGWGSIAPMGRSYGDVVHGRTGQATLYRTAEWNPFREGNGLATLGDGPQQALRGARDQVDLEVDRIADRGFAERGVRDRMRHQRDLETLFVDCVHGQADTVDADRALAH